MSKDYKKFTLTGNGPNKENVYQIFNVQPVTNSMPSNKHIHHLQPVSSTTPIRSSQQLAADENLDLADMLSPFKGDFVFTDCSNMILVK